MYEFIDSHICVVLIPPTNYPPEISLCLSLPLLIEANAPLITMEVKSIQQCNLFLLELLISVVIVNEINNSLFT